MSSKDIKTYTHVVFRNTTSLVIYVYTYSFLWFTFLPLLNFFFKLRKAGNPVLFAEDLHCHFLYRRDQPNRIEQFEPQEVHRNQKCTDSQKLNRLLRLTSGQHELKLFFPVAEFSISHIISHNFRRTAYGPVHPEPNFCCAFGRYHRNSTSPDDKATITVFFFFVF